MTHTSPFSYKRLPGRRWQLPFAVALLTGSLFLSTSAETEVVTTKLNGPLVAGGDVDSYLVSPDGQWVIYAADQDTDEVLELYSAPMDGSSAPVKLNAPFPDNSESDVYSPSLPAWRVTPDSQHVVFLADHTDEVWELYSAPIDGSTAPIKLNGPMVEGGDLSFRPSIQISPDGQRVVYMADQDIDELVELYSVPIDGSGAAVKLNGSLKTGNGSIGGFKISQDSSRVAYTADQDVEFLRELYSVPLDGSAPPVKLNHPIGGNRDISADFQILSDSIRVAYYHEDGTYSTALDGSGEPLFLGDVFGDFDVSPDETQLVVTERDLNIFSVPLDAGTGPILLDSKEAPLGTISGDSSRVAYQGFLEPIYTVLLDGSDGPVQLTPDARSWKANPDGTWIVFDDLQWELFTVPMDGSSAPVSLNTRLTYGDIGNTNTNSFYRVSADSRQIVHLAQDVEDGTWGLLTVAFGGNEAINLTPPLVGDKNVVEFLISPDSRHAVYLADQDSDEVFELYASELPQFEVLDMVAQIRSTIRKSILSDTLSVAEGTRLLTLLTTASQDNNMACQAIRGFKRLVTRFIKGTDLTWKAGIELNTAINTLASLLEADCKS
jgi:Tol biopolymer transport system component